MDWNRTKGYMVIILIILNIILLFANLSKNNEYRLTQLQEDSIKTYLDKNNIKISANIPKTFYPMNFVSMKKVQYDEIELQKVFFGNVDNITRTEEFNANILKKGTKSLIIDDVYILFQDTQKEKDFLYEKDYILKKAQQINKSISKYYGKMKLDGIEQGSSYTTVYFTGNMNGYKNFNNFLNVMIFKDGTKTVSFSCYEKIEVLNEAKKIYSPDEAIYVFAKEIKNLFSGEIEITKIDLGYYLGNFQDDYEYIFKPYYRFYLKGIEEPFFVNAYTKTF